jgi:phage-related tail fiber protein
MTNTLRIKRRVSGAPGAPSALANAELAYNEVDDVLYYGKGSGGAGGTATTIAAIAGAGAFLTLSGAQSVSGAKTFTTELLVPTQPVADDSGKAASTAYVKAQGYLTANQSITISGDAAGSGSSSISLNLASIGTAGTYTKVTTDAKGRVTAGSALTATDIPALTAAKISDFNSQVRSNRLDQLAAPTADLSLNNRRISGLADPAAAQDAATKAYVDATRQGLDVKDSVRVATTSSITLSGTQTIDGIAVLAGNRVLVKNQASASANGIYIAASGSWSRATDFDSSAKVSSGAFCFVEEGTTQADSGWILTTDGAITLGTTALTFAHFSGAGQIEAGSGLTKTGNTLNIASASARRIVVTADAIDLATLGTAGSYRAVTVDAYGRVTAGSNPTTLAGYGISDGQPLDATLTALAGITTGANQLIYATGADAFSTTALTAFGRSLLADADAAAARTSLGLGSLATQSANNVAISGGVISGITIDGGTF